MRVMMVLCDLRIGGAELAALDLVRALRGRVDFLVAPARGGGGLADAFADAGAAVMPPLTRRRLDPAGPMRAAGILGGSRVDVLLIVDVARNAMVHGLWGAALSGRRVARICWCHSAPGGQGGDFVPRLRRAQRRGRLDAIVLLSRHQRREAALRGLARRGTCIIPNGIEIASAAPRAPLREFPADKRVLVHVANVMPDKDFDTLLAAAGRLAGERDDFHLLLVGRGTDSPGMERAANRAGLAGRVTLAGRRDDVPALLAAADVFVLSTRSEVFSRATLEAMAAGLPIVVSDVPGFDEVFDDGVEGLKVAPGRPEELAAALGRLLDDPAGRERLGQAAKRRAGRFSRPRMAEAFERLLRAAVRSAAAR